MRAQSTLAGAIAVAVITCTTMSPAPAYAEDTLPLFRASDAVPLVREAIAVHIDHRYAVTEHRQIVKNAGPGQSEGQYELAATQGAVVTRFSYWNGDDEIRGELFERADATQMYTTVTAARRDPGLLEELAPGRFRYRIFPFGPSEAKRVELRWESLLPARGRLVEYRAPLARPSTPVVVDLEGATRAHMSSETHEIEVEPSRDGLRVRAVAPRGTPAYFSLRYELASTAPVPLVHEGPGHDVFVTLDFPPLESGHAQAARDVTFVVDRSGSESADALERTRAAVRDTIGRLSGRDRVNVIAFDETPTALYAAPRAATPDVVREAQQFVSKIRDGAGTDLAAAMRQAFETQIAGADRERLVVLITDGVSDEPAALSAAGAGRKDVRVIALGVGEHVNATLLERITDSHGGFVEVAKAGEDVTARLSTMYDRSRGAQLQNARLELTGAVGVELAAPIPTTLRPGERIYVALRCRPRGVLHAKLTGDVGEQHVVSTVDVELGKGQHRPWVATAWAKARLDELLKTPAGREEAVEIALTHDLTSKHTAWFAIPASETARVKQQLANARGKKRDLAWARGDQGSPSSGATYAASEPAPPPPANSPPSQEVAVMAKSSGGGMAPHVERTSRGCASCAIVEMDRRVDAGALLAGSSILALFVLRRRNTLLRSKRSGGAA